MIKSMKELIHHGVTLKNVIYPTDVKREVKVRLNENIFLKAIDTSYPAGLEVKFVYVQKTMYKYYKNATGGYNLDEVKDLKKELKNCIDKLLIIPFYPNHIIKDILIQINNMLATGRDIITHLRNIEILHKLNNGEGLE